MRNIGKRSGRAALAIISFDLAVACGGSIDSPLFDAPDTSTGAGGPGTPDERDAQAGGTGLSDAGRSDAGGDGGKDAALDAAPPYDAGRPGGGYDGVCTPGELKSGIYDPDCVYLIGLMEEPSGSTCANRVMILPSNPSERVFGFGCGLAAAYIRPTDGRLLFVSSASINDHTHAYLYRPILQDGLFDYQQLALQERIDTPPCTDLQGNEVFPFPDDGALLYRCSFGADGYYLQGQGVYDVGKYVPMSLGEHRTILGATTTPDLAVTADGQARKVQGIESIQHATASRSRRGGGFLLVDDRVGSGGELRDVRVDGETTILGQYKLLAEHGLGPFCVIEPNGALDCPEYESPPADSGSSAMYGVVRRYTFDSPPQVIYDDRTGPVKVFQATLVTGP